MEYCREIEFENQSGYDVLPYEKDIFIFPSF